MRKIFNKDWYKLITHIFYFYSVVNSFYLFIRTISYCCSNKSPPPASYNPGGQKSKTNPADPAGMWCWLLPLHACKVPCSWETLVLCLFCLPAEDHPSFWRLLHSLAMAPASEASSVGQVSLTSFSLLPLLITDLAWKASLGLPR